MLNNTSRARPSVPREHNTIRDAFSKFVRDQMEKQGRSDKHVATEAGVSESVVREVRKGERLPSRHELGLLIRAIPQLRRDRDLIESVRAEVRTEAERSREEAPEKPMPQPPRIHQPKHEEPPSAPTITLKPKGPDRAPITESVEKVSEAPASPLRIVTKTDSQYSRIEEIDEDLAKLLLSGNVRNRSLSPHTVDAICRDILSGNWKVHHQGIALDREGRLLDGQHRLTALVKAASMVKGTTIQVMVSYNVDPKAFDVIDKTRPRSIADVVYLSRGTKSATTVVAAAKILAAVTKQGSADRYTQAEVNALLDMYEKEIAWTVSKFSGSGGKLKQAGLVAGIAYAQPAAPTQVEEFVDRLVSRVNMSPTMVATWKMVERLSPCKSDNERIDMAIMAMRAAHLHIKGEETTKLYVTDKDRADDDPAFKFFRHKRGKMGLPQ